MDRAYYKVKIVENGTEAIYDYFNHELEAIGFARGYAQCLAESGTQMLATGVPPQEGYQWWSKRGGIKIQVLDKEDKIFKYQ